MGALREIITRPHLIIRNTIITRESKKRSKCFYQLDYSGLYVHLKRRKLAHSDRKRDDDKKENSIYTGCPCGIRVFYLVSK